MRTDPVEAAVETRTKILLVDDLPANLLALQTILEPLEQELVLAYSGKEALKHVLHSDFSVILLDVLMPDLDGFETARLIKEREQSRSIPIIFLTAASAHDQYAFRSYSVGAVDYILKPFEPEILRSKVAVFVDLFRKREQIRRQASQLWQAQQREREQQIAELEVESERRYRGLAEALPVIVWSAGPDGRITYGNRPWFHPRPGPPIWKTLIHPQDLARFELTWEQALGRGQAIDVELRLRPAPLADHRWHLVRLHPTHAPLRASEPREPRDGRASWIVTCTDIDDRRRAEATLRFLAEASTVLASSLDYQATIPRVALLAVQAIADWCIVDLRSADGDLRRFAVAHGTPNDADLARQIERLPVRSLEDGAPPEGTLDQFLFGRDSVPDERWKVRFASTRYIAEPIQVRGQRAGQIALATSGAGHRLVPDHRLVEQLTRKIVSAIDNAGLYEMARQEHARLEEANRVKDEFLAIVSHELRTPLNAVLGWAHLLRTPGLDPATSALGLETIERNAKAQAKLIADILDVSRITSGKLQLNLEQVDLAAAIEAAVDSIRPEAEAKGVELALELPSPCPLTGDAERLQQVVSNLLSNAVKFTPPGGVVNVRLSEGEGTVAFEVVDSGAGISPEFLPHVFDRFRQGDATPSRFHGGLGLGLSIVRTLVALHGGTVNAHSEGLGRGASFAVELPRGSGMAAGGAPESGSRRAPAGRLLAGLRVLLVEDARDSREFLERALAAHGAEIIAVASAPEAMAALARQPDILLSDIGLPGEDGYELIRKVRAQLPDLPAIALTAYVAAGDRDRALAAGFQAHAPKPIDVGSLIELLDDLRPTRRQPGSLPGQQGLKHPLRKWSALGIERVASPCAAITSAVSRLRAGARTSTWCPRAHPRRCGESPLSARSDPWPSGRSRGPRARRLL